MTTGSTRGAAYADLVGALLDARVDPATERFDAELAAAVEAGSVTSEAARVLRYWQRAALRALTDHARSVLPPALAALEASQQEIIENAEAVQRSWEAPGPARPTDSSAPASTPTVSAPSSLEGRRRRLIVADLTTTTPPATPTDRS